METLALFLANESNEYQQTVKDDGLSAAQRARIKLEVYFADDKVTQQIRQIYECLHREPERRPKAIIIMAVRVNSLGRIAREVLQAGIGWICINRRMDGLQDLRKEFPDLPVCFVSPDQREIGRIQGRQFRTMLPRGGQILYVTGEASSSGALGRLEGMREAIQGAKLEIAGVLEGNWTADDAERVVSNWMRIVMFGKSRIDIIGCQNDEMAVGALRALKSVAAHMRRPEIAMSQVTGCDGVQSFGQRLVREGQLAATVIIPSTGGPAINLAGALSRGEQLLAEVLLPPVSFPPEDALALRPYQKPIPPTT
jgi:ABC-type sugar transport system substrate-binding protein